MHKEFKRDITIEAIFWKDYSTIDERSPIKLKVTCNRRTKNFPIKFENKNLMLTPEQWFDVMDIKPKPKNRKAKEVIERARVRALEVVKEMTRGGRPFSHERFEKKYFSQAASVTTFMGAFQKYLNELMAEKRIGTYNSYYSCFKIFKIFLTERKINSDTFTPYDLTYERLIEFEEFLLEKRGKTTLGIYARTLRTIYNYCANGDYQLKEFYPFGKGHGRYKLQSSKYGNKKGDALTTEELRKFIELKPKAGSAEEFAQAMWLFSFYCQGMNFKDICMLTYSKIHGQTIRYVREKTKRTGDLEVLEICLSDQAREIIIKFGNPDKRPEANLFDLLPSDEKDPFVLDPIQKQQLKTTNKWLKRLCKANGLPQVTTYWSRHSYASLLKFQGVSVDMIRELLGHSDVKTTEHYLKRFDLTVKRNINSRLYAHIMSKAS